jgi:hypothetical protein
MYMKKTLFALILVVMLGTTIIAQENSENEAAPSIFGIPGQVTLPMGVLNIRGMVLTGIWARSRSQEGTDADGNWGIGAINPVWEENRFDLYLDYSFLNYGAFLTMRYQAWAPNQFDDDKFPDIRYAFVYGKFLEDKIKASMGKLTDEIYAMPETRLWKTEGPSPFSFTEDSKDDEHLSLRVEFKPIPQLDIGFQYFFVRPDGVGEWDKYWKEDFAKSGVWKEIGFAAQWQSDLFNAMAGVRFDSSGDPLNSKEGYTYLYGYYGDSNYLGSLDASSGGPRYKHESEITGFDGATRAFLGFNVKAVENLDIIGHAGFYNLGAWDKFGYARMNALGRYNNLGIKGFGLGLILSQEFYGNDVFTDDMINSPFFTFAPEVSYKLYNVPGLQLLGFTLTGTIGICQDVLDTYAKVRPAANLMFGTFLVDLYYELEYTKFTDKALGVGGTTIEPETKQSVGFAVMMMF